jgi:hypothetical protein
VKGAMIKGMSATIMIRIIAVFFIIRSLLVFDF